MNSLGLKTENALEGIEFLSDEKRIEYIEEVKNQIAVDNIVSKCRIAPYGPKSDKEEIYPINLTKISQINPFVSYNPKDFGSLIIRFGGDCKISVSIFKTGIIICTGAKKSVIPAFYIKKVLELLLKSGYKGQAYNYRIVNVVCSVNIGFYISLDSLHKTHEHESEYRPTSFPGLILKRTSIAPTTIIIFPGGNIVIIGSLSLAGAIRSFETLIDDILKHCTFKKNLNENSDAFERYLRRVDYMQTSADTDMMSYKKNGPDLNSNIISHMLDLSLGDKISGGQYSLEECSECFSICCDPTKTLCNSGSKGILFMCCKCMISVKQKAKKMCHMCLG